MGKSQTYNVLGFYRNTNGTLSMRPAMNKREMEVVRLKVEREGGSMTYWQAQTKSGWRMLGGFATRQDSELKRPKFTKCICDNGRYWYFYQGKYSQWTVGYCPVCDGLGVAPAKRHLKWTGWQQESFSQKYADKERAWEMLSFYLSQRGITSVKE